MWVARPTLPGAAARRLLDAAVAEAALMTVPVTVVIVDEAAITAAANIAAVTD
jgi:uncharacterized protein GlcG (DUF336 family)